MFAMMCRSDRLVALMLLGLVLGGYPGRLVAAGESDVSSAPFMLSRVSPSSSLLVSPPEAPVRSLGLATWSQMFSSLISADSPWDFLLKPAAGVAEQLRKAPGGMLAKNDAASGDFMAPFDLLTLHNAYLAEGQKQNFIQNMLLGQS
eukprot:GHVT01021012.1.p1 GENE.GHVT01021012.1~~GHVT01021012.1.p1  ORF type:complete len:147 (+),score=12.73 GHVT01021012.1:2086-2526(+)